MMRRALAAAVFLVSGAAHAQQPTTEQQQVQASIAQTIGTLVMQNAQLTGSLKTLQDQMARDRAEAAGARANAVKAVNDHWREVSRLRNEVTKLEAEVRRLKAAKKAE